ncbi:hypothetical protein KF840_07145 [bacterium]|nr:hypothetical protein [bacterium]
MGARNGNKTVKRGQKGEQIFAEVERLTAGGAMKRLAAFEEIAKRISGQPGTVAANYYRIARTRGAVLQRRGPRRSGGSANAALAALGDALKRIEAVFGEQQRELERLRKENRRIESLRRLLRA